MNSTLSNIYLIIIVLLVVWTVVDLLDNLLEFVSKVFKKTRCLK